MNADIVIKSKCVFTGLEDAPFEGGVAVKGNKIVAVGPNEEVDTYIGPDTKLYEYGDNLVLPGICESHAHFFEGALAESRFHFGSVEACTSKQQIAQFVKNFADANPDFERIIGTGWFQGNWDDPTLPTKEILDEVVPDRPVYITSADMHTTWLNSKALEECNIPDDPAERDFADLIGTYPDGELNGLLYEDAYFRYGLKYFLKTSDEISMEIRQNLLKVIAASGITMWDEVSGHLPDREFDLEACKLLEEKGLLTCRINWYPGLTKDGDYTHALELKKYAGTGLVRIPGVKGMIDGVTTTNTALVSEPYVDAPEATGEHRWEYEEYETGVIAANAAGLGVRIHSIGDLAVRWCIEWYEKSNKINDNKRNNIRNAIEHIETIIPGDIQRIADAGIVAAMQPEHLPQDNNDKITRLGEERAKTEWAFKSIYDAGAVLAFGSDYPVANFSPFSGMYFAITRNGFDGEPTGFNPEEKMSLPDVLRAYTYGGAYVSNMEEEVGTLEIGKLADIAVLDRNLFAVDVEKIKDASAVLTIMDGKIVHEK